MAAFQSPKNLKRKYLKVNRTLLAEYSESARGRSLVDIQDLIYGIEEERFNARGINATHKARTKFKISHN